MAVMIIDGVPGAGKTYYAVKHLLKTYFGKDSEGRYELKKPVKIITNIDGFLLDHESLNDVVASSGGINKFFSKDFQEKVFEKHGPVIYMIDEAQMIFDRKFYNRDVFSWFEYHRHYGQNIYLITQSVSKLPRDIISLVEYVIRALPRSRSITGKEFRYNHVSGKDILKRDIVRIDKKIFEIYKSCSAEEVEKVTNPFMKRAALVICFAFLFFYFGWKFIFNSWGTTNHDEALASVPQSQQIDRFIPENRKSSFGSVRRRPPSLSNPVNTGQNFDNNSERLIPHKLNYLAVYGRNNSKIKILFNGRRYSLRTFPYKVEVEENDLIAMIPEQDYFYYFPAGQPERKYFSPDQQIGSLSLERPERKGKDEIKINQ